MGAEANGNDDLAAAATEANQVSILVAGPNLPKASCRMQQRTEKFLGKNRREVFEPMTFKERAVARKEAGGSGNSEFCCLSHTRTFIHHIHGEHTMPRRTYFWPRAICAVRQQICK